MKKEMLINVLQPEETRIAILEDGVLEELYVERVSNEGFVGNIYKGRIVNIEPSIQAAFVDFGVGRNGFLHISDVDPQYFAPARGNEPRGFAFLEPPARRERRPSATPTVERFDDEDVSTRDFDEEDDRETFRELLETEEESAEETDDDKPTDSAPSVQPDEEDRPRRRRGRRGRGRRRKEPTAPSNDLPAELLDDSSALPDLDDFDLEETVGRPPEPAAPRHAERPAPIERRPVERPAPIERRPIEPVAEERRPVAPAPPPPPPLAPPAAQPEEIDEEEDSFGLGILDDEDDPTSTGKSSAPMGHSAGEEEEEGPPFQIQRGVPRNTSPSDDDFGDGLFEDDLKDEEDAEEDDADDTDEGDADDDDADDDLEDEGDDETGPEPREERFEDDNDLLADWEEIDETPDEPRGEPVEVADVQFEEPQAAESREGSDDEQSDRPRRRRRRGGRGRRGRGRPEPAEAESEPQDRQDDEDDRFESIDEEDEEPAPIAREPRSPRGGGERRQRPGGRNGRGGGGFRRPRERPPIQEIFRRGQEVLVQVIKEGIGNKGPTLSTYISIPGRYLVLMPGLNRVGVSRKIVDDENRRHLRDNVADLPRPPGVGLIVRTAGLERTRKELERDLAYLTRLWEVVVRRIKKQRGPSVIYQESDMIIRTIRDIFTSEIDTIHIDEPGAHERAKEFLQIVMPKYVSRLKLFDRPEPLFHHFGIEQEIARIQQRTVALPHGGSIVVDQTEALVAIDVNSGNFRADDNAEETAFQINMTAAREIARQLRLRDLGGVIVNDFIDMREERHRRAVEQALRDAVRRDRARTKVLRMSAFGIIEMTRQRIRPSLRRNMYRECPTCRGTAHVKTVETMSIDCMRQLAWISQRQGVHRIQMTVDPEIATYLQNHKRKELASLEEQSEVTVTIVGRQLRSPEDIEMICMNQSGQQIAVDGSRRLDG